MKTWKQRGLATHPLVVLMKAKMKASMVWKLETMLDKMKGKPVEKDLLHPWRCIFSFLLSSVGSNEVDGPYLTMYHFFDIVRCHLT